MIEITRDKKSVTSYVTMTVMQYAALVELIKLHREREPGEAFNKENSIAYIMGASIVEKGWAANAQENQENIDRGSIVLIPKSDEYEIVLNPQIRINKHNCPPTTVLYHTFGDFGMKDDSPMALIIASPNKEEEDIFIVIHSSYFGNIEYQKYTSSGFLPHKRHQDDQFNLALPIYADMDELEKVAIITLAQEIVIDMDIDDIVKPAQEAMRSYYDRQDDGNVPDRIIEDVKSYLKNKIGLSDSEIDSATIGSNAGIIDIDMGGREIDDIDIVRKSIEEIIKSNGGITVSSESLTGDEDEDNAIRNLQKRFSSAFKRGGGND